MAESLAPPDRAGSAQLLPALDRIAPKPPPRVVEAEIEARTNAGDVVLELHGRGGWVARAAIDRVRRAFVIESTALSRLVAEIVLRPPDVRHFDAAFNAMAIDRRGDAGLRQLLNTAFASRCATCGGGVVVDEFIWDGEAGVPTRKTYRCGHCREGRGVGRPMPVDDEDVRRAVERDAREARDMLRGRFAVPEDGHPLPDQLLDLYTPRSLEAIAAILERIESDLRAPALQAGLRLGLVHVLLPGSRLNGYPGRVVGLRIGSGRLRPPTWRQWRERNTWQLFDEGCRQVRAFVQRLETAAAQGAVARVGPDLAALLDGSANVALRYGLPTGPQTFGPPPPPGAGGWRPERPRRGVRLAIAQPPIHWSPESLGFAYLATAVAVGQEAAETLPLRALFGPQPKTEWASDVAALRRSLSSVGPVLAEDARVLLLLDPGGAEGLVAAVLGAVGAGFRLADASLVEADGSVSGHLALEPLARPSGILRDGQDASLGTPFTLSSLRSAVSQIAVAVLRLRGEPTPFERVLGEVLVGLDRMGYLRRLVGTPTYPARSSTDEPGETSSGRPSLAVGLFGEVTAPAEPGATTSRGVPAQPTTGASHATSGEEPRSPSSEGATGVLPDAPGPGTGAPIADEPETAATPRELPSGDASDAAPTAAGPAVDEPVAARAGKWQDDGPASDPVGLTLELVLGELRQPEHPRLVEIEPGRWWLRDAADLEGIEPPLSERVEWAVFSLLATSGGMPEAVLVERVSRMFRGPDTPDDELVRACIASYRPGTTEHGTRRPVETLPGRFSEHTQVIGMLTEFGHRAGLRVWIARREQKRPYRGSTLGALLSDAEQRVYLPLVVPGAPDALDGIDCIWYVRGRAAFLFDVEWMAALDEPLRRRGARIPSADTVVRFLVIPPERAELVRLRLARSPVLRERMAEDNWHILRWDNVPRLLAGDRADLDALAPLLGLDPEIAGSGEQLALFA
jgi:hypothetical protein